MRVLLFITGVMACFGAPAAHAADPPTWFEYDRPATYEPKSAAADVPMSDGTKLGCGLTLPDAPGPFPVIVNGNTPYAPAHDTADTFWAPRGYATITCNPRGTMSSAQATPQLAGQTISFSAEEQQDWHDLTEWVATQPWSNGRVGWTGFSYGGISAYFALAKGHPAIKAIAPGAAFADAYRDIIYLGGIRGLDVTGWAIGLSSAPLNVPAFRSHPTYDDFWRNASIETKYPQLRATGVPILNYGGWYDIYQDGEPENYRALKDQTWLVMSGGGHLNGAGSVPNGGLLAWFDRWVMGLPSAPLPPQKVTSFEKPNTGGRGWQELADWPPPNASTLRLHLTAAAGLGVDAGPSGERSYVVNPHDGQAKYWSLPAPDDPGQDQQTADRPRQTYDTEPLPADLVLTGPVIAHLEATLSATDGNLVVRVMDVAPDGASTLISTGWLKASHRRSHERPEPVTPGKRTGYDVRVWPTNWRMQKGHVLRLSVSSGDVPRIEPDAPAGTVAIAEGAGGSYADFTVAPDRYDAAATQKPPAAAPGVAPRAPALGLPRAGRCLRGRRLRFRVRPPANVAIRSARVYANGRRVALRRLRASIRLRRGRAVRVRVVVATRGGGRLVAERRYRACR